MKTDDSSTRFSLRRPQDGAVLVVVLLAMIGLLGMGLAGLYLTSGNIQMNSNINMRNQALYVAEGGIQVAKGILNRTSPDSNFPYLSSMLSGTTGPSGATVATPTGYTDEIPGRAGTNPGDYGCSGKTSTGGVSTRGAYLRDDDPPPLGFGCQTSASTTPQPVYIDCNYPPTYSYTDSNGNSISYNATPPDPNGMSATPTQYMGKYTLFIRQDLGECRQGYVTTDSNGIVVIRSEGTASDNRTKVVLEVTMSTNPNTAVVVQAIATVCPAGAAGCDDNASVQQGITVGQPGAGGVTGSGGSGGTGGTSAGCTNDSQCNGEICCNGACVDKTVDSNNCGGCNTKCSGSTPVCCGSACVAASGAISDNSCGPSGTTKCTFPQHCCASGCSSSCVNETSDTNNCGACGHQCTSSQICCNGNCNTPRNPSTYSNTACGPCSIKCTSTQTCCSGVCQDSSNSQNHISSTCCGPCCNDCTSTGGCCGPIDPSHPIDGNYYSCITPSCGTIATMGVFANDPVVNFKLWLAAHSSVCLAQNLAVDTNVITTAMLAPYKIVIVLDVGHSQKDYDTFNATSPTNLYGALLTLADPVPPVRQFSAAEGQVVKQWVQNGGGLFVVNGFNNSLWLNPNFNTLLEPLGLVYYSPSCDLDPNCPKTGTGDLYQSQLGEIQINSFVVHPLTVGVTLLYANGYWPISGYPVVSGLPTALDSRYTVWATYGGLNFGVAGTYGAGRVAVIADEWVIFDKNWASPTWGSSVAALWNNAVKWLGNCP